jgi:hypothetical protein
MEGNWRILPSSPRDETSSEEEDEAEEDVIEFPDEQRSDVPLGEVTNRISFPNSLG